MPPVGDLKSKIQNYVDTNNVMIFSKSYCPFCNKVKELFQSINVDYFSLELDLTDDGADIQNALLEMTGQKTVPNVFIKGKHLGGASDTQSAKDDGRLVQLLGSEEHNYEYDLIVIGGGSGGLAASKRAAEHGKKVAVLDFVKPSPQGTSWGLGGTCVNVGCIPKKLMHQAALLREGITDAHEYGWEYDQESVKHNWGTMVDAIQQHIGSLNWGYRVQLRNKSVKYVNSYGVFKDNHTIEATDKKGKVTQMTANHFIIATGGRPQYPDIPGAKEFCISSDDLFSLPYCPGKTLVVGASYVSLECAGFLSALGLDVTVCVRSILLRGFDQQMAEQIGDYMEGHGIKFIRPAVPTKVERLEEGQPGKYRVTMKSQIDGSEEVEEFNTVMFAVGRYVCTKEIGLDTVGVQLNPKNGKVISESEHTNVKNLHAIGDVLDGKPELTPVAIQAGRLLADRLFAGSNLQCDYVNVPTTVFTPLEYGAIGYAEEVAIDKFGYENIEVYHTNFQPLEWTVAKRNENACYAKLICNKADKERVIGFHVLGPNAGEITQGYGVAMKMGATKADFDRTIGIHPTCSEIFTTLDVTKSSGESTAQAGC